MPSNEEFKTFQEFYPFYLSQHMNKVCRYLHYLGTCSGLFTLLYGILAGDLYAKLFCFVPGYFFAWIGHFFFENNKPATFKYPGFSFRGDWVMCYHWLTGQLDRHLANARKLYPNESQKY